MKELCENQKHRGSLDNEFHCKLNSVEFHFWSFSLIQIHRTSSNYKIFAYNAVVYKNCGNLIVKDWWIVKHIFIEFEIQAKRNRLISIWVWQEKRRRGWGWWDKMSQFCSQIFAFCINMCNCYHVFVIYMGAAVSFPFCCYTIPACL